jgi:hypothetical protein
MQPASELMRTAGDHHEPLFQQQFLPAADPAADGQRRAKSAQDPDLLPGLFDGARESAAWR